MDAKVYVGCLALVALLALLGGASIGAVAGLVASKFVGALVLLGIAGVVVLAVIGSDSSPDHDDES
jgi:hypothetical protein